MARAQKPVAPPASDSASSSSSAFERVVDALYAVPPREFTAARNAATEQARHSGDRALATRLQALRRPTASAHALNLLVRAHPEYVAQLRELGADLARAQQNLEGTRLRELSAQRTALVTALAREARQASAAAGQPVGEQATAEIEQTLRAVLADQAAADELAAGHLEHALTPGADLPDLPGLPVSPDRRPAARERAGATHGGAIKKAKEKEQGKEKGRRLADAEQAVRLLEDERHAAEADLARARTKAARAAEQLKAGREQVVAAEQALMRGREAVAVAEQESEGAQADVHAAERHVQQARQRLADQQAALASLYTEAQGRQ